MSISCWLGKHDWVWEDATNACEMIGTCRQCKRQTAERRPLGHRWSEWQPHASGDCLAERVCKHCGTRESGGILHSWNPWSYEEDHSCGQIRTCERCGVAEHHITHCWGDYAYKAETTCDYEKQCLRCGAVSSYVNHIWHESQSQVRRYDEGDHSVTEYTSTLTCTRCGHSELKVEESTGMSNSDFQAYGGGTSNRNR